MIREDNITMESLREDLDREHLTIKEYVMRGEGAELFTVAINKQLLDKYKVHPRVAQNVFQVIPNDGKDIRFPLIYGGNPEYIPELGEYPFGNLEITATTVYVEKYGFRMGLSQEMIDDNEVALMQWTVGRMGDQMAALYDKEAFKALHTYFSTGAAVAGDVATYLGHRNRGAYYTTGTFTNGLSASGTAGARTWEDIFNTAINQMKTQTITLGSQTVEYPVYVDTVIVPSQKAVTVRKILNATNVIIATGLGGPGLNQVTQLGGGKNFWNGVLNVVESPYVSKGTSYITAAKRGLVILERTGHNTPRVEKRQNWAYDAEEAKVSVRMMPAVIEQRSVFAIVMGTA